MKRFFIIAAVTAACIGMVSCNNNRKGKQTSPALIETTSPSAMEVDNLLAEADSLTGKEVTFQGVCTHTCKHGARKIFVMGSDDTQIIRVEAGSLGAFSQDCVNNIVSVTGTLKEQRIDEAYLQNWELQAKSQTEEQHGNSEAGCDSEKNARGETGNSVSERIADFRRRITEEKAKSGKEYLSFYYVEATSYEIEH